jgi:hypothetical protein
LFSSILKISISSEKKIEFSTEAFLIALHCIAGIAKTKLLKNVSDPNEGFSVDKNTKEKVGFLVSGEK